MASEALFWTDFKAYRAALVQFRQDGDLPTGSPDAGAVVG